MIFNAEMQRSAELRRDFISFGKDWLSFPCEPLRGFAFCVKAL